MEQRGSLVRREHDAEGHAAGDGIRGKLNVPMPTTAASNEFLRGAWDGLGEVDFAVMLIAAKMSGED